MLKLSLQFICIVSSVFCNSTELKTNFKDNSSVLAERFKVLNSKSTSLIHTVAKNRYWLDLKNTNNQSCGNMMIIYMPGTTTGYDDGYDGLFFNDTQTALTTIIDNHECVINAMPPSATPDPINLKFKTNIAGTYSINLQNVEGIFAGSQTVYLMDTFTGNYQNLKLGNLTFTCNAGVYLNRFVVFYDTVYLSSTTFLNTENAILFECNANSLLIRALSQLIESVFIFDISGKMLQSQSKLNSEFVQFDSQNNINQLLIAQIILTNGVTISKKIVLK